MSMTEQLPQPNQQQQLAVIPKGKKPLSSLPTKRRRKNTEDPVPTGPRKQVGQKGWIWPFWTPLVDTRPGYSKCNFCLGELSHCNPTRLKDHLLKKCKEFLTHEDALRLAETESEVKEAMLRADSQGRLINCSSAVSPRSRKEKKKKEAVPSLDYSNTVIECLASEPAPVDAFQEHLNSIETSGKRLSQLIERVRHLAYEKEEGDKAKIEACAAADLAALHTKLAKNATAYAKLVQSHHDLEQQLFGERDEGRKAGREVQDLRDVNHKLVREVQELRDGSLKLMREVQDLRDGSLKLEREVQEFRSRLIAAEEEKSKLQQQLQGQAPLLCVRCENSTEQQ